MRCVRAAIALATVSGAESSERVGFMWISASHTTSKPQPSAAAICANESAKARACDGAPVDQNSWKTPNSITALLGRRQPQRRAAEKARVLGVERRAARHLLHQLAQHR